MLLEDKVALVVGIKDKIGSTTSETMAREGAKVVIADRNPARGRALAKKIVAAGGEAIFQELDVTLVRYQETLIKRIVAEYGRLDIAFNNVNVEGDCFPLAQQSEGMVAGVIDVNFNGMWLSMRFQIEQMLKNGGGAIVNNVCNFRNDGSPGCSVYRATQSAVDTMSRVAAIEYARSNIRINAIASGFLADSLEKKNGQLSANAAIVPMNRGGSPQEIADTVVWLCSDKASYITGHTLFVDGGLAALTMD